MIARKIIQTSKVDDRWNGDPYELIYIPVDGIPVYKVKSCETGKVVSKDRNSLLPLFGPMSNQPKLPYRRRLNTYHQLLIAVMMKLKMIM